MIRQNLHCHSTYDDGADAPEQMVLAAEAAGLRSLGISLHCPIIGEDDWCCSLEEEPLFIREMHRLRDAYHGRIEVWCGLEYDLIADRNFAPYDYIIASCHFLDKISLDNTPEEAEILFSRLGAVKTAERYYAAVSTIADIPDVDIVGHFDVLTKFVDRLSMPDTENPAYRDAAFSAMETLHAAGKIFEINTGAVAKGWRREPYPASGLLRHLRSLGGRICISSDAHCAAHVAYGFEGAAALARACGFSEIWQFTGETFEASAL